MKYLLPFLRFGAAVSVAGLPLATAFAQSGGEDSGRLEEITVTAERREASIQDVPVAVSAFSDTMLEKLQIDETIELVNVVPNLFGGNNTGLGTANMYYLRAQGNDESIATFDPPVGTYVDDVYITRQNANNFTFFDVERIEVLRGPQGTLFGRNTTGGAINVILKKPAEELGGFFEVGFGRYSEQIVRGTIDIPFSERVLTKFSAFYQEDDGWLDNLNDGQSYNGRDNQGIRAALRFLPTDTITWDLSFDYMTSDDAFVRGSIGDDDDDRTTTTTLPQTGVPAGVGVQKSDYGNETETTSIVSDLSWGALGGDVSLILGYRDLTQDFLLNFPGATGDDFFWIDNNGEHEMTTVELKWVGEILDDRVDLVTGLFYLDEDNSTDFADYLFGAVRLADRVLGNTTESFAFYAQGDIAIGDAGTLTIGARYTDETKEVTLVDNTGGGLTTAGLIAAGIPTSQDESVVTPRIAYRHQFNDDISAYASATRGFKTGGWNAREGSPANFLPFGPETIWSYEAGLKAEWADGRVRTNATVFFSDLEDLQTTSATADGGFLTTNAGGLENTGVELELTALPTDNWEIFLGIGLQDAEYVSLPSGCTTPNEDFAAFDEDCNVADPKRSPDTTVTLATNFNIPVEWFGGTVIRPTFSARYIGDNVVGTRNQGPNGQRTLFNAGVTLADADDAWSVVVECRNCTNEVYTTSELFVPYFTAPGFWQARLKLNF
ncbi:MAG: TonB-dependent receptor, partial [Pseudomonadota bacterium]